MFIYNTNNFGEITIGKNTEIIELDYKNQPILVRLIGFNDDFDRSGWTVLPPPPYKIINGKDDGCIHWCASTLDQYPHADEIARQFFIDDFSRDKFLRQCFEDYFKNFTVEQVFKIFGDRFSIEDIVGRLDYPDLFFEQEGDYVYTNLEYKVSDLSPEIVIGVTMELGLGIISYGKGHKEQ